MRGKATRGGEREKWVSLSQGWRYGKGLIYYRPVSYIYVLRAPDCIQTVFFIFSIFTLSNLGDSSNLIGSLSQTRTVNSKFRAFCLAPITIIVKLFMTEDPENPTLFSSTYPQISQIGESPPPPLSQENNKLCQHNKNWDEASTPCLFITFL